MNNKIVSSAIKRYLSSDNRQFALQINGAWGTGKTYFIRHMLFNHQNDSIYTILFNNIKRNFLPVYISLSEINDINELRNRIRNSLIINSINNTFGKNMFKMLSFLGSNLDSISTQSNNSLIKALGNNHINTRSIIKFWKEFLSSPNKTLLLVFDDLERTGLPAQKLVGFISNFINEFNCKTIIISNESRYYDYKNFENIKEKIISKVVHFGNESTNIAENILKRFIDKNNPCKEWDLSASKHLMLRLDNINLRTIYCIISTYNSFSDEIKDLMDKKQLDNKLYKQLLKTGYLSIFTLTDAVRRNMIKDTNILKDIFFDRKFNQIKFVQNNEATNYKDDSKATNDTFNPYKHLYLYNKFFLNSDFIFSNNILYSRQIYKLVVSDEFDPIKYCNDICRLFYKNIPSSNIAYGILNDHLKTNKSLSDGQIKYYENSLIKSVDFKYVPLKDLLKFYSLCYSLNRMRLFLIRSFDINSITKLIVARVENCQIFELIDFDFSKVKNPVLRVKLNLIKKRRMNKSPLFNIKHKLMKILDTSKIIPASYSWFRNRSICQLILGSKKLQNKIINNKDLAPINRLRRYFIASILKDNDSFMNHSAEMKHFTEFNKFINYSINNLKDNLNTKALIVNLNDLSIVVKKCDKDLRNHKMNQLPF